MCIRDRFQDDQIGSILAASMVGTIHDGDKDVPQWGSVVRCLFKSEIIRCNHVAFPTDIYFAEDLVFTLRYLSIIKKAIICDQALYRYRCNTESIMNSFFSYKSEMFHERKKLISYIEDIITEFPCQEELSKRLHITARCYYRDCVGNACRPGKGRTSDEKKLELREILNDSDVKEIFKKFDTKDKRTKIIYLLIKYRLASIIYIYYYYRFKKR